MEQDKKVGVNLGLSEDDKQTLLKLARSVIESAATGKKYSQNPAGSNTLQEPRGAFVSLNRRGKLRGCIGNIHAHKPLLQTIQEMAYAAAFEDPRFNALTREELDDLEIEISVLTPMEKIDTIEEIEIGKHGLYIVKKYYHGLLLPQVATEYGWDRKNFLEHTCTKAGLPKDAWKDKDTEVYIFSADIF